MHDLGLTLSGGGFRATLFHLGVVRFLFEAKCGDVRLLTHVRRICSVSGGSVLGAHLTLKWRGFTGTETTFNDETRAIISLVRSDVRGRIQRRAIWSLVIPIVGSRLARIRLLTEAYKRLYGNAQLSSLKQPGEDLPELHILATSMRTGEVASFNYHGLSGYTPKGMTQQLPIPTLLVARAVAASSAFPPAFPPVMLLPGEFGFLAQESAFSECYTDGGVFDNLGVAVMNALQRAGPVLPGVVVSNASGVFDWEIDKRFRTIVSRTWRTSDILMQRVADLERLVRKIGTDEVAAFECKIDNSIQLYADPAEMLNADVQRKVRLCRTDFDTFSDAEIVALVRHGYEVAKQTWQPHMDRLGITLPQRQQGPWYPPGFERVPVSAADLDNSGRRSRGLWNAKDWVSYLNLIVFLLLVLGVLLGGWVVGSFFYNRGHEGPITTQGVGKRPATVLPSEDIRRTVLPSEDIRRMADKGDYAGAIAVFEKEKENDRSGVIYSAYPDAAFAYDQLHRPADALEVLSQLRIRVNADTSRGLGYLGRAMTIKWVIESLEKRQKSLSDPSVAAKQQELVKYLKEDVIPRVKP